MPPKYPSFRKGKNGPLLSDSQEARSIKFKEWTPPLPAFQVDKNAKEIVKVRGGDVNDRKDVLGEYTIQSGKFKGQSFRWLMENCPGYVGWMIGAILDESSQDRSSAIQLANKNALLEYATFFTESKLIVRIKIMEKKKPTILKRWEKITGENQQVVTPPKFTSNLKKVLDSPVGSDDLELIEAVGELEKHESERQTYSLTVSLPHSTPMVTQTPTDRPLPQQTCVAPCMRAEQEGGSRNVNQKIGEQKQASPRTEVLPLVLKESESSSKTARTVTPNTVRRRILQETDSSELGVLVGWRQTLPEIDHKWISDSFFIPGKRGPGFDFSRVSKLWYEPPQPSISNSILNKPDRYFAHRFFLWMPRHLFYIDLRCPHTGCNGRLTNAGVHQKTRVVLDVDSYYNIAAEYLNCPVCSKKVISWSEGILDQLDNATRSKFPCILTSKSACDLKVVRLLRQRSLGNSSSAVCKQVEEQHGERYLTSMQLYLSNCKSFKKSAAQNFFSLPTFQRPPDIVQVPRYRWFMKVYQLDVIQRIDYIKASITSTYGTILKMDSTKKITKKLAGRGRKTAMWATNVGNEYGQILMSVLTEGEGLALRPMIEGLIDRYTNAGVPPPHVMYVDRDCCGAASLLKYFDSWPAMNIRLDIWHFMRRFPYGCTTDKHPLYSTFMGKLSQCIFKWDEDDLKLLCQAKRAEMEKQGIKNPSEKDITRRLKSAELALHCKRMTRGTSETVDLISSLLKSLEGLKGCDTLGVPLFDSNKMPDIWKIQSRHVPCIQDPEGISLYTKLYSLKKGGIMLPVYRCGRGSTSLESFHLHMNRFIPGTLANDINFQVFLLDGLFRWNADREAAATSQTSNRDKSPRTYSGPLKNAVNKLSEDVWDVQIFPDYQAPGQYTGELIGIEYLYSQTGKGSADYKTAENEIAKDDKVDEEDNDEGYEEPEDDITVSSLNIEEAEDQTYSNINFSSEVETTVHTASQQVLHIPSSSDYQDMIQGLPSGQNYSSPDNEELAAKETAMEKREVILQERPLLKEKDKQLESTKYEKTEKIISDDEIVGPDNIPGYGRVLDLADFLVSLRKTQAMTSKQVQQLRVLWTSLSDFDKKRTVFSPRYSKEPLQGRFKSPKKKVAPGVESIERVVLGPNQGPAQWPNCNRYTEATVQMLLKLYPSDLRRDRKVVSRFSLVLGAFHSIRDIILGNHFAMEETDIQLPLMNKKTLLQWFNEQSKVKDKMILTQGLDLPTPTMTVKESPVARTKPTAMPTGVTETFKFHDPPSTEGMATVKSKKRKPPNLPSIAPRLESSSIALHLITIGPDKTAVLVPVPNVPNTTQQYRKRKSEEEQKGHTKRKYVQTSTVKKCSKCGDDRIPPAHQQYMGYRYCPKSDMLPFSEWRDALQKAGVARKKNNQK